MAPGICRGCGQQLGGRPPACPYCGLPDPAAEPAAGRVPARPQWGYEWRSRTAILGWPLVHVAMGRDHRGRLRVARGIIAVGQFGVGLVTVAQFGVGLLFGVGQVIVGLTAVAQAAVALLFGLGQFATGYVAIGQLALGVYVLAQVGLGEFLWTPGHKDAEAVEFFRQLAERLGLLSPPGEPTD